MLALVKKTNYIAYDPSTSIRHFLNGITDPALAQAKLSLKANHETYSGNFDATVEYLMNQVEHHQVNQQLNIASICIGAPGHLWTCDDQGNDLEILLICYLPEEWAQLSSAQKSSIHKHCTAVDDEPCGNRHGGQGACGGGGGNCKCQRQNQRDRDPKSAEYHALAKSIATLTKNVSVMATHMSGKSDKDNDAKPAADDKMASNSRNSALCKTPKKEKE